MIEPMKRVVVVGAAATQENLLAAMQRLGALHLVPLGELPAQHRDVLEERIACLEKALTLLTPPVADTPAHTPAWTERTAADGLAAARDLLAGQGKSALATQERESLLKQREAQAPLGPFNPQAIRGLGEQGVFVRLYTCSAREFNQLQARKVVRAVAVRPGWVVCAHVSRIPDTRLPLRELPLPESSLDELDARIARCEADLTAWKQRLAASADEARAIAHSLVFQRNALALESARAGMGAHPGVCFIQGFCPTRRWAEIKEIAKRHGWAVLTLDPVAGDNAPTLLSPSRCASWFLPVLRFLGVTPGYHEPDATGVQFAFFSLFVGMIVGDAGYGCLMLVATLLADRWLPRAARPLLPLCYVSSVMTLAWGTLTGMWFGSRALAELPVLRSLVLSSLDAFSGDDRGLMRFCLWLGAMHLSIAHGLAAVRSGARRACGELGWIGIVWGVLGVCDWLLLGIEHPTFVPAALIAGGSLVLVFGEPNDRDLRRGVWSGVRNLPLSALTALGCFADVLSYIRLFAVGLATQEVATVFNGMASRTGLDNPFAVIAALFIVAWGHTLNFALAALSILVHGLRLNLLEFGRHLGVSWNGIPYAPFQVLVADADQQSIVA